MPNLRHADTSLRTDRLELIPATPRIARADVNDRARMARLLGAAIPPEWPPPLLADHLEEFAAKLEARPFDSGLSPWYWIRDEGDAGERLLIGSGGFLTLDDGGVMLGYSVLDAFQRRGYATEAVAALVRWAFRQPEIDCIVADTFDSNPASIRVLEKNGFMRAGDGREPGSIRFACGPAAVSSAG
jgi:ribosomal-protein-alanine N-acetyltransferase